MEEVYRESLEPSFELRDTPLSAMEVVLVCGTLCLATAFLLSSACLVFQSHCIRALPARRRSFPDTVGDDVPHLPHLPHLPVPAHLVLALSIHDPPVAMPPFVLPPPPPPPSPVNEKQCTKFTKQFTIVSHPDGHVALGTQ
jgi:hypothetical protein